MSSIKEKKPNRLFDSSSPYLQQHAFNPVKWYPWSEEAFEKAGKENKPIFLSIGYSTCHWCHVMAHESFEDEEVAELMNRYFVSIKVDREERPDLDHIYMVACQLMTGSGGWPLTIIMTPDKKVFFAGTYFPRRSSFGKIGMMDLLPKLHHLWENRREEILDTSSRITSTMDEIFSKTVAQGEMLDKNTIKKAFQELLAKYDSKYGGFGTSPKFPSAQNLFLLLRYWKHNKIEKPLEMVETTLKNMRKGGIYDHIGFGFHRYSTDREWLVPHFEKMLYDQALISQAYLEAYQVTGKEEYARTASEIFQYVLRDLASPEGGFYSAEDADSEGEEGKFYLWTRDEIFDILGREDGNLASTIFTVNEDGNYFDEVRREKTGKNILHRSDYL
ncbi:MAG: thioredoxin domain-containing protein, partial [Vulcanimicrobiota bacterium]